MDGSLETAGAGGLPAPGRAPWPTASSPPCLRWARLSAKQPVLLVRYLTTGMTVALFGRRASIRGPTIPRFVAKLGFSSYREFPGALREGMEARAEYL